jgi:hypothetical protein
MITQNRAERDEQIIRGLPHELGTELWTAGKRLANAAQAAGAGWAHWIGEPA